MLLVLTVFCLVTFAIWFRFEPRAVWPGFLLLFGLIFLAATVLAVIFYDPALERLAPYVGRGLTIFAGLILLSPGLVGLFLLGNFVVMGRKEGLGAKLTKLSGVVGAALVSYSVLFVVAFVADIFNLISLMICSLFPLSAIALGFIAFVIYSGFYQWFFKRFGAPVTAVVVLGAYVRDGKVTPLLAKRIDQGIALLDRAPGGPRSIPLVMSGGQGGDEIVPEAQAMKQYAIERGIPAEQIWTEEHSANTEENLLLSKRLLRINGVRGQVAVATNDYHAFRAATMMRRAWLPGYAVGYRTARYFWPSAMIREYAALLRDHLWFVIIMLGLSLLPLVMVTIGILLEQ